MSSRTRNSAHRQSADSIFDPGALAVGWFYLSGVTVNAKLLTINGRVYESSTDGAIAASSDVEVDTSADQTADAAITAYVAAINADTDGDVWALAWSGNSDTSAGMTLLARDSTGTNYSLTTNETNGVVSAAAFVGADKPTARAVRFGTYTVTAADVTALALGGGNEVVVAGFPSTATPQLVAKPCVLSSAGVVIADNAVVTYRLRQVNSAFYVLVVDDSGPVLSAGDVISFAIGVA